jgi:hypothetical protein
MRSGAARRHQKRQHMTPLANRHHKGPDRRAAHDHPHAFRLHMDLSALCMQLSCVFFGGCFCHPAEATLFRVQRPVKPGEYLKPCFHFFDDLAL